MDCELAQQQIALFAYGELPDDQCHALEGHLSACKRCQEEFAAVQALQQAMALAPALEPSANMLTQARMRLEEALDSMPRTGWLMRVQQSIFRGVHMLGRALLVLGLSAGSWGGYQFAARNHRPMDSVIEAEGKIANVTGIVREPHTENVEVHFNRLVPETAQGSLDDKRIRELLLLGAQSPVNPGVQQNSVSLLAEECGAGHQCDGGPIRQSLLVALRYDKSTEVRMKALDGLQPYVAQDMRVRDAVLEALMADPDSTVRSRAIEVLQPVGADSSVREVLHTVASQDDNPHIRTVSQEALDEYPHIQ
jgi:hypothetical protein